MLTIKKRNKEITVCFQWLFLLFSPLEKLTTKRKKYKKTFKALKCQSK